MSNVTITFDPDSPTDIEATKRVLARLGIEMGEPTNMDPTSAKPVDTLLWEIKVAQEIKRVQPAARKALRYIYGRGENEVSFDDVIAYMDTELDVEVTGEFLGGLMSTIGHSAPTLRGLLGRDYNRRVYLVDVKIGERILQLIDEYEHPHDS